MLFKIKYDEIDFTDGDFKTISEEMEETIPSPESVDAREEWEEKMARRDWEDHEEEVTKNIKIIFWIAINKIYIYGISTRNNCFFVFSGGYKGATPPYCPPSPYPLPASSLNRHREHGVSCRAWQSRVFSPM